MRAHLVQFDIAWEDPAENHRRVDALLAGARIDAGDLILLPEMFDTGFSLNVERTADTSGRSAAYLAALARRSGAVVQGGVTAVGPDGRGRNRALVYDGAGREIARYDKVHPFSFGREPERFAGGDRAATYGWGAEGARTLVAPIICYDLRFPELFRAGLLLGAEAFAIGANWPSARVHHWRTLLAARAIENQAVVLGVNRCGADPFLEYPGASAAIGPRGETLGAAGSDQEVLGVEVDPEAIRAWRREFPAWHDGRPGLLPSLGADGVIGRTPV